MKYQKNELLVSVTSDIQEAQGHGEAAAGGEGAHMAAELERG